jgi:hypothetical protein
MQFYVGITAERTHVIEQRAIGHSVTFDHDYAARSARNSLEAEGATAREQV